MLDRHAVQELVRAGVTARVIAKQFGVSVRTVRRILREEAVEGRADDAIAREVRRIGRPRVTEGIRDRVRALIEEDTERPAGEISRLLREEGTPLGLSRRIACSPA